MTIRTLSLDKQTTDLLLLVSLYLEVSQKDAFPPILVEVLIIL